MSDTHAVDQAVNASAMHWDVLDSVMELRLEADRRRGMLAEEVYDFSMDRSRLAADWIICRPIRGRWRRPTGRRRGASTRRWA